MEEQYFFHVISDIPKKVGEHIILDDKHPNGVHKRVYEELETVNDIYRRPTFGIAKIKVTGRVFEGDAYKCFDK